MLQVARCVVALAGFYLIVLGGLCALRPAVAKRFLHAHASTLRAHVVELTLRAAVGMALVVAGPTMRGATVATFAGWLLIITTVVLAIVPWRQHRRFAAWSVPMATRSLPLLALGSLASGAVVLTSLTLGARNA